MTICFLGLGSNLRSPERQLRQTIPLLKALPGTHVVGMSSLYHSTPLGRSFQPGYCNQVVAVCTRLSPEQLLHFCHKIEKKQGRVRKRKWGSRTLDIDLLLFENRTINTDKLTIPHPEMLKRSFVLMPLIELIKQLD